MEEFQIVDTNRYGKGVFAKRFFKEGELLMTLHGKEMNGYKYEEFVPRSQYWLQIEDKRWLDLEVPARYINHSCDPNIAVSNVFELRALRDIQSSEEILLDYDMTDWDESFSPLSCLCSSTFCRGIIKGYKFLSETIKEYYKEQRLIPEFLLQLEKHERK